MENPSDSKHNKHSKAGLFRRFGIATVFSVFVLILVGGIVRSTGSGMGCPDWPKCFGSWIPPTDVSQLPSDYREIFSNEFHTVAEFSVFKTWTEYINRLLGTLIGILIFITLLLSVPLRKEKPWVFRLSFAAFVLVAFVGWLGAKVVYSNLLPGMITLHMLGALLVTGCLVFALALSHESTPELGQMSLRQEKQLKKIWGIGIFLAFLQLILGTQVREAMDLIALHFKDDNRELWIAEMPLVFYIHRSMSLAFIVISYLMYHHISKIEDKKKELQRWAGIHLIITFVALILGIILAYLSVPAFAQPLHLLTGSMVCFTLMYIGILLFTGKSIIQNAVQ